MSFSRDDSSCTLIVSRFYLGLSVHKRLPVRSTGLIDSARCNRSSKLSTHHLIHRMYAAPAFLLQHCIYMVVIVLDIL